MKKYTLWLVLLAGVLLSACTKEDDVPRPPAEKERTFFIYMAADNSLDSYGYSNINSLVKAMTETHLWHNNVVIYHDPMYVREGREDAAPRLLEVVKGDDGKLTTQEIRRYEEQNSASVEVFSSVLNEVLAKYDTDKFSLLMWSHGTGWLPVNPNYSTTRAIGQDGSDWLDTKAFADAIPAGKLDYILFDACYMAGVEVAYELRKKADWVIAAATETPAPGMPYDVMPTYLFGANPDLAGFCDYYYSFYTTYPNQEYGAVISLIKTAGLETLAAAVKNALGNYDMEAIQAIPYSEVQYFDRTPALNPYAAHPYNVFFDLEHYIERVGADEAKLEAVRQAIAATVASCRYSSYFINLPIARCCGLSSYIPRKLPHINAYYETLGWYKAVYE